MARALRHAVVSRLARTLGRALVSVQYSTRISAIRREFNSHEKARQHNEVVRGQRWPTRASASSATGERQIEPMWQARGRPLRRCQCCSVSSWSGRRVAVADSNKRRTGRPLNDMEAPWCRRPRLAIGANQGSISNSLPGLVCQRHPARPNPSLKPSPNGGPPGPGNKYGVHCLSPGPGVPPLGPAYLER